MSTLWALFPLLLIPFLTSSALTLSIEGFCRRFHIFDLPGERKMQVHPVPRLGGAAFFVTSFGYALGLSLVTSATHFLGALIVFVGGFIDDINPKNSVKGKLVFQIPAAAIFVYGCPVDFLTTSPLQSLLLKVVLFGFIFFMTNATNLMDNMDGLAAGISIVILTFLTAFAYSRLNALAFGPLGLLVIASLFGFVIRNFPSGKIYMGDQGSQFLGYFTSTYAVLLFAAKAKAGSQFSPPLSVFSFVLPTILLFGLFLLDVSLVVAIRLYEKRSPFVGDQCHLSHQLVKRGFSPQESVLLLIGAQIVLGFLSFHFLS